MKLPLVFLALLAGGFAVQDEERILLGSGAHTYEWVRDWPTLPEGPEGMELGYTHGCIAIDSQDRIYLETNEEHAICVFDTDGKLLRSFGAELAGGLHGMTIAREGEEEFLYVTHLEGKVLKLSLEGEVLWELGYPAESGIYEEGGPRYHPTSVAVAMNGDLYVADGYGRHWIHRYDKDQKYLASYGGPGEAKGKLKNPHGIFIEERFGREVLVVADRENRRLQVFDLAGKPLRILTNGLRRPCHAARRGDDLVVPDIDGKVTILDAKGKVLTHLGEHPDPEQRDRKDIPRGEQDVGLFHSPHCAQWDSKGDLYVVDWMEAGRLTKLRRVDR